MAVDDGNRYWADPALRSRFFDIDEATGRHRRFFDIDHLAAVRQEDEHVFEETHKLALRLAREGTVDGLRVDHPDGLADPAGYLRRLRDGGARHVWVEKILDPGEPLRDWAGRGDGRLRVPQRRRRAVRRPGRRGAADRPVGRAGGRRPAVRRGRLRGQARAGARAVRARGGPAAARGAARGRRARAHARLAARLPHLRRAVVGPAWRTPTARRSARPGCRSRSSASCCSASAAGTRSSRASSRRRRRSRPRASRTRPSTATGGCWR